MLCKEMPSYEGYADGRYAEIRAYAEYTGYRFDVWESGWFGDKKVGNGTALRPVGICFVTYRQFSEKRILRIEDSFFVVC
ncbi:TPA: hypothetical protein QCR36_002283 [Bacillus cereus]|uniref:Uncharacterized protein n=3 Tax=Bacillaceae TaxID=186817 RepID=A0A158RFZ7_BACC3|nr:conserved hypothetical protein [Bacillus cereus 03BB102]AJG56948.1 hypothetical protein AW22_3782 [Bacillus cereus D17]MBL3763967.1 hypothetical protein [Bacillus cereus]HDR7336700.1 hypothetical protein [Bacillus anthracis]AJG55135.1 hypothetical protein AS54_972 [Bacillus cereus 03BB102]